MSSNKYLHILLMVTNVYLIYINCIIVLRDLYVHTMVLMFYYCTKMNYTMMSQLLRHYYMSHLCYFVGELRVNSHVNLVAQFKPKLYTCTCEQCMICACYV